MGKTDLGADPARKPGLGLVLKLALAAVVLVGAAWAVYVIGSAGLKPAGAPGLQSLAKGGMEKLAVVTPKPPPAKTFVDADGKAVSLSDFKGQVLVVNLWATWCAPCKVEMPTLAALQKAYEGQPVKVVAISVDKDDKTTEAKAFIAANAPLSFFQEASLMLPYSFDPYVQGFPTTALYDKSGQERARLIGEADWSTPEAKAVIDHMLTLN